MKINKWMKFGVAGLLVGSASIAPTANATESRLERAKEKAELVDLADFGGSKLKDRMIIVDHKKDEQVVRVLIDLKAK